jgi:hypothetical protein
LSGSAGKDARNFDLAEFESICQRLLFANVRLY